MKNIEMIPSEKTFIDWVERNGLELSSDEASLLLGYISGHGYGVTLDARDLIALVDTEERRTALSQAALRNCWSVLVLGTTSSFRTLRLSVPIVSRLSWTWKKSPA